MNKKIGIASILGILFIILSVLVSLNLTEAFDNFCYEMVTFKMNDIITKAHYVFTFFGSTLFIILLSVFVFMFCFFRKKKNEAYLVAVVVIISTICNNVIKLIIRRERPVVLALVTEKTFSFPSGHTMASVSLYGIIIYLISKSNIEKKKKIILSCCLGIIPILVALSRIYLGAHFASDVIGASLLGIGLLLMEITVFQKKIDHNK